MGDLDIAFANGPWPPITKRECRVLILDSSFNPPTRAHEALLATAVQQFAPDYFDAKILLFSTSNADKQLTGASVEQRTHMMELLAQKLGYECLAVGLTKHAKFVDKAVAVERYFQHHGLQEVEMYFILGYDTVTRFLDPKYYAPLTVAEALEPFFARSRLICADRAGFDEQLVNAFWTGDKVKPYLDRILRMSIDPAAASLSSTRLRTLVKEKAPQNLLTQIVDDNVADYIVKEHLYSA
ncbi:uncharacterized protein BYT42DRAFT_543682 [Radiomyces spectabilis]|uniref:uncharacterized protein n=1 Tax=Radiomyces spectabilis TaxID=64574 RepID=UPI00221F5231|nr:uncharacterized protein BYT42DRAFT_543682 [Radiomyces spectabilis]KAI8388371.1 hypothetical protein BYT42DRAFT_543682 [Radiomyces spectabilis]